MVMSLAFVMTAPCLAQDDHCYQRTQASWSPDKIFVTTNAERSQLEHHAAPGGNVQSAQFKYTVVRLTGAKSLHINLGYLAKGPEGQRRATLAIADAKAGALVDARRSALAAQPPAADLSATEGIAPGSVESETTIDITPLLPKLVPALEAGKDALLVIFNGDRPIAEFFFNGLGYPRELKEMAAQMDLVFPYAASGKCPAAAPSQPPTPSTPGGGGGTLPFI
jgi:hypothetical protein